MTFNEFIESDREVYELTRKEWIKIHEAHMLNNWRAIQKQNKIVFNDLDKRINNENIESGCFHKEQVESALKKGIKVSEAVLKDYKGLKEQIEEKQRKAIEKENSKILLTYEMVKDIKENTKLIIDGYKVTLKEIKKDCIICKPYKTRNKIWSIALNNKVKKFVIGWN